MNNHKLMQYLRK